MCDLRGIKGFVSETTRNLYKTSLHSSHIHYHSHHLKPYEMRQNPNQKHENISDLVRYRTFLVECGRKFGTVLQGKY